MAGQHRIGAVAIKAAGILLALVCAAAVLAAVVVQTAWFHRWAARQAEAIAGRSIRGEVTIGRLEGNLFTGADLIDVVVRTNGRTVVAADRVSVRYALPRLLSDRIVLDAVRLVRLVRPAISLIESEEGWNVTRLVPARDPSASGGRAFAIEGLEIDHGVVTIQPLARTPGGAVRLPRRIFDLNAHVALSYDAGDLSIASERMSFEAADPALSVRGLSGGIAIGHGRFGADALDVRTARSRFRLSGTYDARAEPASIAIGFTADPADLPELAGLIPALSAYRLSPRIELDARGRLNALHLTLSARAGADGALQSDVHVDLLSPVPSLRGTVVTTGLNLAPWTGEPRLRSAITATTSLDVSAEHGWALGDIRGRFDASSDALEMVGYRADRLVASGRLDGDGAHVDVSFDAYRATVSGTAVVARHRDGVTYDATGRVSGLDLRRLPQHLHIPRLDTRLDFQYDVAGGPSRVAATVEFGPSVVEGAEIAPGGSGRLAVGGGRPTYAFDGELRHLDVARFGRALSVDALEDERLESDLNGRLALEGSGTTLTDIDLHARGDLDPSRVAFAEVPRLTFDATLDRGRLTLTTLGEIRNVDLGRLNPDRDLAGVLNATFDVTGQTGDLREPLDAGSIAGGGRITIERSRVWGFDIDRAEVAGSYANRLADVSALNLVGPDLAISGAGFLSLAPTGASDFTYRAEVARLDAFEPFVGRPLGGSAYAEGAIQGNRSRLVASGPIRLLRVRYDDAVDALSTTGDVTVILPDLDASRLSVEATVESTVLTIGGQPLSSASFTARYADSAVAFDSTLREGRRTATLSGRVSLHPDHQEIHVAHLTLGGENVTWSTPAGRSLDVDYSGGLLRLNGVRLEAGSQRLAADGTLALSEGGTGRLDIELAGVDLAELSELFLVQRTLEGRLNATVTVSGPPASRQAHGTASVTGGTIDEFTFESMDAEVDYAAGDARVDATVRQASGATLQITGRIPAGAGEGGTNTVGPLDLRLESTSIDLSVVQAATTAVTGVTGSLALDVQVSGTVAAPLLDGTVDIRNGGFTVASTGVEYRALDTRLHFEDQSVVVDRLTLLDGSGHTLHVAGRAGVEGRSFRDVDITVTAEELQVLDNEFGNVSLDATVDIGGSLGASRVAGLLRVHAGRIDADRILERIRSNAYEARPPGESAKLAGDDPLANLVLNLAIDVPNNLVVAGNDLRGASGPALGDVNVTVGGTFRVIKDPGLTPQVIGTVTTVRGTYDFQGRRFSIVRDGTIAFRGDHPIDPALGVTAERQVSGVVARVHIEGTARDPAIRLSSDPPMEDSDILSLIVFNQPSGRLGEGERVSLAERATALAGGVVVGSISESIGRALNLSVFEVETVEETGGVPMVTVGKQVGERLFVRLRQLFGAQKMSDVELEYMATDYLRLQASVAEGQGLANRSFTRRVERGGLDLVLFLEY